MYFAKRLGSVVILMIKTRVTICFKPLLFVIQWIVVVATYDFLSETDIAFLISLIN